MPVACSGKISLVMYLISNRHPSRNVAVTSTEDKPLVQRASNEMIEWRMIRKRLIAIRLSWQIIEPSYKRSKVFSRRSVSKYAMDRRAVWDFFFIGLCLPVWR